MGTAAATTVGFMVGGSRLRVLGFHGILEFEGFTREMEWLVDRCTPVNAGQVVAALDGAQLPPRSVWVTFDDGHPSVVEQGLPVLAALGVPATIFVCPGVVDTTEPYWWEVVERATELGLIFEGEHVNSTTIGLAKSLPDGVRREMVNQLKHGVESISGKSFTSRQVTLSELRHWVEAGHSIGNHTWDHPLLDRCLPDEQRRQVAQAHEWIVSNFDPIDRLFAYPNGNWSMDSELVLKQFGYHAATLFDHRISDLSDPFRVSRLRTNADGNMTRFRAIVAGIHPALHQLIKGSTSPGGMGRSKFPTPRG